MLNAFYTPFKKSGTYQHVLVRTTFFNDWVLAQSLFMDKHSMERSMKGSWETFSIRTNKEEMSRYTNGDYCENYGQE